MAGASGVDWTGILFVGILALRGVTRKTERTFARTAGLFSTPQRPVGVCIIQISRCFVVSLCALLTAPLSVSPSSVQSLSLGPGWCWAVTCSGQGRVSDRRAGPHNSHCAAFSACDDGTRGTRPSLAGSQPPDNTPLNSNWHSGQGRLCQIFSFN